MNDKELNQVVAVMRWILSDGEKYFRMQASETEREVHERLAQVYQRVSDRELDGCRASGQPPVNRYIHARPITVGSPVLFPVIKVKWAKFTYLTLGLHIGLFEFGDVGNPVLSATGWRFESPSSWEQGSAPGEAEDAPEKTKQKAKAGSSKITEEATGGPANAKSANSGPGLHEYFHAQAIKGFDKSSKFPSLVEPINDRQPAFRLEAWNAPSLSVNALVSLYGRDPAFADLKNNGGSIQEANLRALGAVVDDSEPVAKK